MVRQLTREDLDIITHCGLISLIDIPQYRINMGLLTTQAKRWHSDHNTFHLLTWEMTVTLKDVYHILQILVMGKIFVYGRVEQGGTNALHRIF